MTEQPKHHWSMASAIEQISKCDFACEAGPLTNNDAWIWLSGAAKVGPEYWPGQGVWFEVSAEVAGTTISKWMHFYIVGCAMGSDTEKRTWSYDLSRDPPGPYHYGKVHFKSVHAQKLRLSEP